MIPLPAPGVHRGVSDSDYRQWEAVNQSTLKDGATMLHVRHNADHPTPPTEAMELGTKVDMALTDPARFSAEYAARPKFDNRKAADKEAAAKWDAENAGKKALSPDDLADVLGMAKALREHPAASKLFSMPGDLQVSLLWKDAETGLMCKARIDRLCTTFPFVVDLKSTANAEPWAYANTVHRLRYHWQAAWYLDGSKACGLNVERFIIPAVEQKAPYAVCVYDLGQASIELGRIQYRAALSEYARATKTGIWTGFPKQVQPLEVPAWALRGIDVNSTFEAIA